jgi:hypothetical protein
MVPVLPWKSFIYSYLNTIHILMCIVGAIGCALPLQFQVSYIEVCVYMNIFINTYIYIHTYMYIYI